MNEFILDDAISCLDSDLIEDHIKKKTVNRLSIKDRRFLGIKRYLAIAVCLCLISMTCVVCFNILNNNNPVLIDCLDRPYKDVTIAVDEQNVVWSWDCKPIYEKWESINLNGVKYIGSKNECNVSMIGANIGSFEAAGYDRTLEYDNTGYRESFNVYEIKKVSHQRLVAVKLEDKYYVYASEKYSMPDTLGEAFAEYGLASTIELNDYSWQYIDTAKQCFAISDDSYIWAVLESCKDAKPINDIDEILLWYEVERNSIDFFVNSEALGVYNKIFKVTQDGYIWSNAFYGEFIYYVGSEATENIISFVKSNSTIAEEKAREKSVMGSIIEITDEYILIDDSLLCEHSEDAIRIKIMSDDIRISRYIEKNVIGFGDTVRITYDGKIALGDIYVIDSAVLIEKISIVENNIIIPE